MVGATAFLAFRLFDIVKPPPARGLQRLQGGLGILVDDLIARYELVDPEVALALARLPESIRGYGPVKERAIAQARATQAELEGKLLRRTPEASVRAA